MPRSESSGDKRLEFVLNCVENLCNVRNCEDQLGTDQSIAEFLNDVNCRSLDIKAYPAKDGYQFETSCGSEKEKTIPKTRSDVLGHVYFVKHGIEELTDDNIHKHVVVTSMNQSPLDALYHSLHSVYAPALLKNPAWASHLNQNIQSLLCQLDNSLESVIRRGDGNRDMPQRQDEQSNNQTAVTGIFTPMDEILFWEDQVANLSRGSKRRRAETFSKIFQKLREPFASIQDVSLSEVDELIEETQSVLDDLWKVDMNDDSDRYPQERMAHLFRVIGNAIMQNCAKSIGKHRLWVSPYSRIKVDLEEASRVCEKWRTIVEELITTHWANIEHPWRAYIEREVSQTDLDDDGNENKDHGFVDESLSMFIQRLDDLMRVRTTHEELKRLLSAEEQESLRVDQAFDAFINVQPLHVNRYTQPLWEEALVQYEKKLGPIQRNIASKLSQRIKTIFNNQVMNPQVALSELMRYKNLVSRPEIKKILVSERETVLSRISGYIDELDAEFDAKSVEALAGIDQHHSSSEEKRDSNSSKSSKVPPSRNLSPTVNAIIWGRQMSVCVENIYSAATEMFEDLSAFRRLEEACQGLSGKIESWISDIFRDWSIEMEDQLADGELSLHLTGQLMEIDMQGLLQVNFSERLVKLLREVRQLGELGLSVPSKVKKAAKEAESYYRYGVMLKKTANFFNSMETQIISSQKSMLFEALVEFEREVTNPRLSKGSKEGKMVTWGDPSECHAYVERLGVAADKLSAENRRLHKIHENLGVQVVKLLDIDLLRQTDRWKHQWSKMLTLMGQVEGSYEPKRMAKWKGHWDHQVYKSLEASYKMGLESLNENLGEIKAELIFSNHKLQFRPPIEELRTTYYRKMKKFIAIPSSFTGFSGGSLARETFGKMADRNPSSLLQVYNKAEQLFGRLMELCGSMQPIVILGMVTDLDALVEQTCTTCDDWELNFKMLKVKRRELDKIQDFYKIDCFSISTTALKMAVEDQFMRLSDALMLSLRKSVLTVLKSVETYLNESMERLSKRPESIEEISEATGQWNKISNQKAEIKKQWDRSENSRKLLLSMASSAHSIDIGEVMETHGRLPSKWENFEIALIAFNDMIEDQRETLKARVDDDVAACRQSIDQFVSRWESLKPGKDGVDSWHDNVVQNIFDELEEWKTQFETIQTTAQTCVSNCEHFELEIPRFEELEEVEKDFQRTQEEWGKYKTFSEQLGTLKQKDWIGFRLSLFDAEDLARHWLDNMKGKARGLVLDHIAEICNGIRKAIPALKFMRGEPFKEEHWSTLFRKLGMPKGTSLQNLTFGHFVDVIDVVADNLNFAKDMTARAQGEVTIREAITELKSWAETATIEMMDHEEMGRSTPLIKNWKDILTELGDNQSLLASLKESPYFKPFEQQAALYEANMASLDEYLSHMNQIQRKWLYLEPIFGRGALPSEANRFRRIDEDWVDIMHKLNQEPLLFNLCDENLFPRMQDVLGNMVDQLERCQKALADFLEEKRSKLPRFYFIGDDDLLEILGQAKNPTVIQSHLKKLFQGIHSVVFNEDQSQIVSICSSAGEVVPLEDPVTITDQVEVWLQNLSDEMRRTLKGLLVHCVHEKKQVDLAAYPSQILCLAENIKFTMRCEHAIKQGKIDSLKKLLRKTLQAYTSADLNTEPLSQLKVKSLILDLVHNIDVCEQLENARVGNVEDWHWDKQLRYYLNKSNECVVRMCDAEMKYTYEYWGNAPKLVHTPLTDKCYLTLTQGMHMGFGGSPYGPAGTGKTESVKALGSCLGRQVLVFNCDEGIDFQSMGRIFTGLVKCGAWGCFDEFNRLKEDQLSAVSQQIQVIQAAIKEKNPSLKLLGKQIDVDFNAGIFVTMNPAGKGYGGRSKLPDNLKQLFRPVAMSRPDNNLIAEVILYSEGFQEARDLGQKLVSLYALSKELLSPQLHYDWGLRAMKAVLNTGGKLVMEHKMKSPNGQLSPEEEREILIKAIRVNTLSKLTFVDSNAFLGLIGDIFPGSESRDVAYEELENAIRDVLREPPFCLEYSETQVRKMMQLKESLDQRMGCVIVGPSGCGKTTLWSVLKAAMKRIGTTVKTYVMNPKSMPRERLLGYMDMDTREWFDGVLTNAARQVVKEPKEVRSWIVCDGDVDPEWIESLNSVLDDNKLLTMPNGERISFGSNVNFIFETHDLRFASPATISRMGMIFLSDEDVDVKRLIKCWLNQLDSKTQPPPKATTEKESKDEEKPTTNIPSNKNGAVDVELLRQWIEDYFYEALDWVLKQNCFIVETTMVGTVKNGLSHITLAKTKADFVLGLIRGLGGNLDVETRNDFAKFCFEMAQEMPPNMKAPLDCFADRGVLAAFSGSNELEGEFDRLAKSGAIIQTVSVKRKLAMIQGWVERMEPFILVGPEGSGKTMLLTHCFNLIGKNTSVATLHCNAQTTASHVIQKIQQACSLFSTNSGRVYRPRESERLVLYLKDINLPKPDKYDTCMLIAFLQQLITMHGFYDDNLEFLGIERIHIVASMNPATTVGRHILSPRFTAAVRIAYVDYPAPEELVGVYGSILEAAFLNQGDRVQVGDPKWRNLGNLRTLAETMVNVYKNVKSKFSVDDHRHYLFTPRDLTQWVLGLLRYDITNENLLDIFAYEGQRLFKDRLVDQDSKNRFDNLFTNILRKDWQHRVEDCLFSSLASTVTNAFMDTLAQQGGEEKDGDEEKKSGDDTQIASAGASGQRLLVRITLDEFKSVIEHGMNMYEREEQELDIKLFQEVLEHFAHVDRVLSKPGGSMLLVGRSGVGRRTASVLVAHMQGMKFFTPNVLSGVGNNQANLKSFYNELKQVIQNAGVEGQHTVLYVEDHQMFCDEVLETLNSLLCSGEVPGLYKHEELVPLLDPLKEKMQEEIQDGSVRTTYEYFVRRIQQYLHVVVSMDYMNDKFLIRCESNPALYTNCSILWFGEWSRATLDRFPGLLLPQYFGNDAPEDWDPEALSRAAVAIHEACKARGATPRDLVSFLECFHHLHELKAGAITKKVDQFLGGLAKLEEAAKTVDELSEDAEKQRIELQRKQQAADQSMEEITEALQMASKTRKETEDLSKELKVAEDETLARKAKIEDELSEIQPILESAKEAVGKIKADHLNELRSLKMPPDPVADVLSAVLMLLGIQDTSWLNMKKFLGNRGVKDDILNFDTHRITPEIRDRVVKILRDRAQSFERSTIQRVSVAAAPFAAWVKANIRYSLVLDKIQPLEAELDEAKRSLEAAQERMKECEDELQEIDDRVKTLQDNFKRSTKEAAQLNLKLQDTEQILEKAQKLIQELSGEQERWSNQARELKATIGTLPMRILLSAAFVNYLGKTSEDIRRSEIQNWASNLCHLDNAIGASESKEGKDDDDDHRTSYSSSLVEFDVKRILSSESEMLVWKSQEGLPGDGLSMENAIIILNSPENRSPFIIDPARSALGWLKAHFAKNTAHPFEVVGQNDSRFVNQVELSVRFGKILVVTDVDGVEPMLYPLIRRDLKRQGPRWVVQVGDKLIDFNEKFRLVLVTRNPEVQLPPDASSLISEVNFTVTRSGLEGQLLGVTVQHEQPELEQQKSEVLKQEENFKVQLADLEKELLDTLAASEGNLLENQALLDTLTKTKEKSQEVSVSLEKSAKVSIKLDTERNRYRAFARAGSQLYFTITGLSNVNHMYQFSLQAFIQLFRLTLAEKMDSEDIEGRMEKLISSMEKRVLYFCGRALFKCDRLMFALHLVHNCRPHLFQEGEWSFFIGELTGSSTSSNNVHKDDDDEESKSSSSNGNLPSWIGPDRVAMVQAFQERFPRLYSKLDLTSGEWAKFGKHPECEKVFPANIGLTHFQRVLVIQVLRPDRLESAMINFCCDALGVESLSPPASNLSMLLESDEEKIDSSTPFLLIVTPGADPTSELKEYAQKTVGKDKYIEVAMGGGQTTEAITLLRDAARNGDMLCLKNLHLVSAWIPVLEKEFNSLDKKNGHFRLFLTTEETKEFSPLLLQQSLKVTFESPPGVKQNLQRTYGSWSTDLIETGGQTQARLLFLLAWLHAIIQERRTYIPQGWGEFYEFSMGDLRSGTGVVQLAIDTLAHKEAENEEGKGDGEGGVDWSYIHGLMENSVYGGRISSPFDLRVLRAYLKQYFNQDMLMDDRVELCDGLRIPERSADREGYLEWIEQLEDNDSPVLFGLPQNIERSVARARGQNTCASLKSLSHVRTTGALFDKDKWNRKLQPFIKLWQKLGQNDALLSKPKQLKEADDIDPITMFVYLENERAYNIVSRVDKAIQNISSVVTGNGLLSPKIQADATSLIKNEIPQDFLNLWEGPTSPQEWLKMVAMKKVALQRWIKSLQKGSLLEQEINLSELFNPGTFLNALRQQTARKLGCSMDRLALRSSFDEMRSESLQIRIVNLLIQGAKWENGGLLEPESDAPEVDIGPSCYLTYVNRDEETQKEKHTVSLPLYKELEREKLLLEIEVPLARNESPDLWITRGVAFFLSSN